MGGWGGVLRGRAPGDSLVALLVDIARGCSGERCFPAWLSSTRRSSAGASDGWALVRAALCRTSSSSVNTSKKRPPVSSRSISNKSAHRRPRPSQPTQLQSATASGTAGKNTKTEDSKERPYFGICSGVALMFAQEEGRETRPFSGPQT